MKRKWILITATLLSALLDRAAYPQSPPDANQYVSREEYNKLKGEIEALKAEMAAIRKERAAPTADVNQAREVQSLKAEVATLKQERAAQSIDANQMREVQTLKAEMMTLKQERAVEAAKAADVNQTLDELNAQVAAVKKEADYSRIGDTKFLLTGYAFAGYTDRKGDNSTFSAGFNPIFIWQLNDRLLFEGEMEYSLETPRNTQDQTGTSETNTSLEYADMTYILNDYMTVGAGKFKTPLGIFNSRLESKWINKLPDRPLPYDDTVGIAQEASIGAFIRGAVPYGSTKWNYNFYVANGPSLITDNPSQDGMMDFDNFEDNNHNKAVGGRLGFLPIPELELGYSTQIAQVSPPDFQNVDALTQAVDASYMKQIESIRGTIDLRTEWVWSDVSNATYTTPSGPLSFDNDRRGYYIQAAYRPTMVKDKALRNLEFVLRYDSLQVPRNAPGSSTEYRWTPGIDYWITPSTVVKVAYQFVETSGSQDNDAVLLQAAMGF
jgi:hypothetical protein